MPVLRLSKGGAARQVELARALRYRLHAIMIWQAPSGRRYSTTPARYAS